MLSLMAINNGDINFRLMLILGHGSAVRMLIVTTSGEIYVYVYFVVLFVISAIL